MKRNSANHEFIAAVAHMNRNYVEGSIKGRDVEMLIDTGASISCISLAYINKLGMSTKSLKHGQSIMKVRGVGGEVHSVIGNIDLNISIGGFKTYQNFHVFEHLYMPVILGYDFLKSHKATIDTGNQVLTLVDGLVSICLVARPKDSTKLARANACIVIPPRSHCNIPLRVSKLNEGKVMIVEPVTQLNSRLKLMGAKTLVTVHRGKVNYLLINPTNATAYIRAGYVVAHVSEVDVNSIQQMDTPFESEIGHVYSADIDTENREKEYMERAKELEIDLENSDLTEDQKRRLLLLIGQHRSLFATTLKEIGRTSLYTHRIDTGDAQPIRQRFFRHSPQARKETEKQVKELLEHGLIRKSTSDWTFPVVMVKKKDSNSFRMTIDYRKLNAVTRPMSFPIPTLDSVFDTLGNDDPQYFTTIDLQSGYWQVGLHPDDQRKAAFITQSGVYEWEVMPMGLRNSSSTFMLVVSDVLRDINWKFALVYIDDILIFSKTFEEHLDHIQQVLQRFKDANLTLKASKCRFAAPSVEYLGHKISRAGIEVNTRKTKVVREFPKPRHAQDVRSFLGLCNYFRRFIKGYAQIALPLNQLLRKDAKFQWTNACQDAFEKLKEYLTTPPLLAYPRSDREYQISCDASNECIGFILEQKDDDGKTRPVAYGGRALRGSELAWTITEKECLAVVEAIKVYHPYLANTHFDIYTDHIALKWLQSVKQMTGRLARWSLLLQGYDFTIYHRPGKKNTAADALSRREYDSDQGEIVNTEITEPVPVLTIDEDLSQSSNWIKCEFTYRQEENNENEPQTENETKAEDLAEDHEFVLSAEAPSLKELQRSCEDCDPMIKYLENGELPQDDKTARKVTIEADQYVLLDGILYHMYYRRARGLPKAERLVKQLVVPKQLRHDALQSYHDSLIGGGHQGFERTYHALRNKYYWPGMYRDVHDHVQSCLQCQQSKNRPSIVKAPLHPLPVADIFSRWNIDYMGPVVTSDEGYRHILVVTDSFTKWCEAIPTKTQEAKEVAEVLYRDIITRYGAPKTLVSDRGRNFMSGLVQALSSLFDIKRVHTSSYHPQTNSAVERMNSVISQSIRTYCNLNQKNWPSFLPGIMMAYRATPCTQSTQYSPYFMVFGREMKLPFDIEWIPKENLNCTAQQHLARILENLETTRKIATENIEEAQKKYKKYYDLKVKEPKFEAGDKVWLYNTKVPVGLSKKFHRMWTGPYYITLKGPNHTYKLRDCADSKEMKSLIHANRMKPFNDPDSRPVQPPFTPNITGTENNDNEIARQDKGDNDPTNSMNQRQQKTNPTPIRVTDNKWYEIDKIMAYKRQKDGILYKVRWKNIGTTEWVPSRDVSDFAKQEFHVMRTASGKRRKRPLGRNKFFERSEKQ